MQLSIFMYTFVTAFVTLFPVMNPIGTSIIINSFFQDLDEAEKKSAMRTVLKYSLFIALGTLIIGRFILLLFGLEISIIQLGGGIIICFTGYNMLTTPVGEQEQKKLSDAESRLQSVRSVKKKLFYPITFPIVMGAGAISVILTLMASAWVEDSLLSTGINYIIIAIVLIGMLSILYILTTKSEFLLKRLRGSTQMIINRLIAFIMFCIGIQIAIVGFSKVFNITVF